MTEQSGDHDRAVRLDELSEREIFDRVARLHRHPLRDQPAANARAPELRFFNFASGHERTLLNPAKPLRYGVATGPHSAYVLYAQADYQVSDLMLLNGIW